MAYFKMEGEDQPNTGDERDEGRNAGEFLTGQTNYTADPLAPWNYGLLDESRRRQLGGLNSAQGWAEGNGPSAALAMLQGARDQNINAASSMAKSLPGGNLALAQRTAALQGGQALSASARDASAIRAQEQQQAMEQWMKGLADLRKGDVDVYGNYAQGIAAAQAQNAETARNNANNAHGLLGLIGL